MNIQEFAAEYHLKIKRDSCDDQIIIGKLVRGGGEDKPENHHHVYEVNGNFLAYFNYTSAGKWNNIRKELLMLGCSVAVNYHTEGVVEFDPKNKSLTKAVLKHVRVRFKRQLSEEQKAAIRERFTKKTQ